MEDMASNAAPRTRTPLELTLDDLFGAVEQEWQEQALCAQTDPEAFFPEKGGSTVRQSASVKHVLYVMSA